MVEVKEQVTRERFLKMMIKVKRDILMREAKQEKSQEYKDGYIDGVLDMYNSMEDSIDR